MDATRTTACDPGGRDTGIVVRERGTVLFVEVLTRVGRDEFPGTEYLNLVCDVVAAARDVAGPGSLLAVEGLRTPEWFIKGKAKPLAKSGVAGLMGTCMTYAAVISTFPDAIVVPPGGNGSAPLSSYPQALRGGPHNPRWPHPEPKGNGILRHARSAWDVAYAAPRMRRARGR